MSGYGPAEACMVCVRLEEPERGWAQCLLRTGHAGLHESATPARGVFRFDEEFHETMVQPRPR